MDRLFHLSIHLLMHICVVSTFHMLQMMLLGTFVYEFCVNTFLMGKHPGISGSDIILCSHCHCLAGSKISPNFQIRNRDSKKSSDPPSCIEKVTEEVFCIVSVQFSHLVVSDSL